MKKGNRVTIWSPAVLVLGIATAALGEIRYVVSDLGAFGRSSVAYGVNDLAQVTGRAVAPPSWDSHAFLYEDGVMNDIGGWGSWNSSVGLAINNAGQVTGRRGSATFLYQGGVMTELDFSPGANSSGKAINSSGQIAGFWHTAGEDHAFLYSAGVFTDIGTLGGWAASGNGVNDAGWVVGYACTTGNAAEHAFVWNAQQGMQDIGDLGNGGTAHDINNHNQVVGDSGRNDGKVRAWLYSNGVMTDIGALSVDAPASRAWAINDRGEIVGQSDYGDQAHGFIYKNGVMWDLNDLLEPGSPEVTIIDASAINEIGQIVGTAYFGPAGVGDHRAVLLTPIPEPATLSLLALGGLALVRSRRK